MSVCTIREAAGMLHVPYSEVAALVASGKILTIRRGNKLRLDRASVARYRKRR